MRGWGGIFLEVWWAGIFLEILMVEVSNRFGVGLVMMLGEALSARARLLCSPMGRTKSSPSWIF